MIYREYSVRARARQPLLAFLLEGLKAGGCTIIRCSPPDRAPFRISYEMSTGERGGIVAYAFFANSTLTHRRPDDEHRFQIKYSAKRESELHELWQDPFGLYTTLLIGIDPGRGFLVGADPILNSPTRFFISKEFKREHVSTIVTQGWHSWERVQRGNRHEESHEVLVGAVQENVLRYAMFEREARGEDQGHRQLLAERFGNTASSKHGVQSSSDLPVISRARLHALEKEFELSQNEILDLIDRAPRLRMAVRGWVAQRHLVEQLRTLPDVAHCEQLEGEGQPDVHFRFHRGRDLYIECKNVLRKPTKDRVPRLDFMRTRASIGDPCSRYYSKSDFDVVAACLHAQTEHWSFRLRQSAELEPHSKCPGKLSHRVMVDEAWSSDMTEVLRAASAT